MSRPAVEVRRAAETDLDDLAMLWSRAREENARGSRLTAVLPPDQLRPRLREAIEAPSAYILIARWEGRAAGYAVLRLAPVLVVPDGSALHVDHLFVLENARRHGVARALLIGATAIAERHGADQILAGAPPSARDAHRFLARLGFSPLIVRRAVGTAALRRRLAGEGQRRGLEDLLSRRRSLRARALRGGWPSPNRGAAADGASPDSASPDNDPVDGDPVDGESVDSLVPDDAGTGTAEAVPTGTAGGTGIDVRTTEAAAQDHPVSHPGRGTAPRP